MRGFLTPLIALLLMAASSLAAVNVVSYRAIPKKTEVAITKPAPATVQVVKKATPAEASVPVSITRQKAGWTTVSRFSGTAVGENTVLTCAHAFQEPGGLLKVDGHDAQVIKINYESDVALLSVKNKIPFVEYAANQPTKGEPVTAWGYEQLTKGGLVTGYQLRPISTKVIYVNRYNGPATVSVAGSHAKGRSGGGLYNAAGQLIGVCGAADYRNPEGIYAGIPAVQSLIDGKTKILTVSNQAFADNCPNGQCPRPATVQPKAAPTCQCQAPCPCKPAAAQPAVKTKQYTRYASRARGFVPARQVQGVFRGFSQRRIFAGFRARSCCN